MAELQDVLGKEPEYGDVKKREDLKRKVPLPKRQPAPDLPKEVAGKYEEDFGEGEIPTGPGSIEDERKLFEGMAPEVQNALHMATRWADAASNPGSSPLVREMARLAKEYAEDISGTTSPPEEEGEEIG